MRFAFVFLRVLLLIFEAPVAQESFERHFEGLNRTFVLPRVLPASTSGIILKRARERCAPCSTLKIAHTAIFLRVWCCTGSELQVDVRPGPAVTEQLGEGLQPCECL
jgi:hypothetical protein